MWEIYPPAAERARAAAAAVGREEIMVQVMVRIVFMDLFNHNDGFAATCALGSKAKPPDLRPGVFKFWVTKWGFWGFRGVKLPA